MFSSFPNDLHFLLGDVFPQPRGLITHRRAKSPGWLVGIRLLECREYSSTGANKAECLSSLASALVEVAMARMRAGLFPPRLKHGHAGATVGSHLSCISCW